MSVGNGRQIDLLCDDAENFSDCLPNDMVIGTWDASQPNPIQDRQSVSGYGGRQKYTICPASRLQTKR